MIIWGIVLVVDEAQVAYECTAKDEEGVPFGGSKASSRFFNAVRKIQNQGRAVSVTFWQGTQDPTNENLPIRARNGAHIRASLVVATESQSRMGMGDAAVDAGGAAPHELRQGRDKGVLVVKDADNTIETVRTHFIDGATAEVIAERAHQLRGVAKARAQTVTEARDLLTDVAEVLGDEGKVKATDVVARLRELAPNHRPYAQLNADKLRAQLDQTGAKVTKSGVLWVYAERVHQALAERETGNDAG
jgi:DNA segregation ATPase FtsK/SpoIIIE, S-DNA-T family